MEKALKVEIPLTPNFIKVGKDYQPVASFTDKELEQIGKEWTKELIEKGKRRRSN